MTKSFAGKTGRRGVSISRRAGSITVGNVATLPPGSNATITNAGSTADQVLDVGIPRGIAGTPTISLGNVITVPLDTSPTVTNAGTTDDVVLEFGIPRFLGAQGNAVTTDSGGNFANSSVSADALQHLRGLRSDLAAQLDGKQQILSPATTALANILSSDMTPDIVVVADASGNVTASSTGVQQLWYLAGLDGNVQADIDAKQDTITGAASSVTLVDLQPSKILVADATGKIAGSNIDASALTLLSGATSDLQAQLDSKQRASAVTGAITSVLTSDLSPDSIAASNSRGKIVSSNVSSAVLEHLRGARSDLQSQLDAKSNVVTGAISNVTVSNLAASIVVVTDDAGRLANSNVSAETLWYLDGTRSDVQTQLDGKLPPGASLTGAITTVVATDLPANRVVVTDGDGKLSVSLVSSGKLAYLAGAERNVADQLGDKQPRIAGAAANVLTSNLAGSAIVVTDSAGNIAASNVSVGLLAHVSGIRDDVQAQIDGLQDLLEGAASSVATSNLTPSVVVVSSASGKLASSAAAASALTSIAGVGSNLEVQIASKQQLITGAASTIVGADLDPLIVVATSSAGKVVSSSGPLDGLWKLAGLAGNLQAQLNAKQGLVTGAASSITAADLPVSKVLASDASGKVAGSSAEASSVWYLDGLVGNVQAQLDAKQDAVTGALTTVLNDDLPPSIVVASDPSGKLVASSANAVSLWYLDGLTSNVQEQLNSKQANVTGALSTAVGDDLDPLRIVIADAQGKMAASNVLASTLEHIAGVTGNIESGLSSKQPRVTGAIANLVTTNLSTNRALVTDPSGNIAASNVASSVLAHLVGLRSNLQLQMESKQPIVTGAVSSIVDADLSRSKFVVTDPSGKLASSNVDATVAAHLLGLRGNVELQLAGKQAAVTGAGSSLTASALSPDIVVVTNAQGKLAESSVSATDLWYLDGLTSNVQAQLNAKQPTVTGALTSVLAADLPGSKIVVANAAGKLANSNVHFSALLSLVGLTSNLQRQLDAKSTVIDGAGSTAATDDFPISKVLVTTPEGKLATSNVDASYLLALDGLSSDLETQLLAKQSTVTGALSSVVSSDLVASKVLVTDAGGKLANSNVSSSKLAHLANVTSNVQAQLDTKQAAIPGAASTIASSDLATQKIAITTAAGKVGNSNVHSNHLWYLAGTSSNVRVQLDAKANVITGAAANVALADLTAGRVLVVDGSGNIAASNIGADAVWYLEGLRSDVQAQLNSKAPNVTGALASIVTGSLPASRVMTTDASGKLSNSSVSSSSLHYLTGTRGNIQSQLDAKFRQAAGAITPFVAGSYVPRALASDGIVQWLSNVQGTTTTTTTSIADDMQGGCYVSGHGTNPVLYSASGVQSIVDSSGLPTGFVAQYHANGTPKWMARVANVASSVAYDGSNVFVAGYGTNPSICHANGVVFSSYVTSNSGTVLAKYTPSGNVLWTANVDGPDDDPYVDTIPQSTLLYPPAPLTANTTVLASQSYGSGTYVATASSGTNTDSGIFTAFNGNVAFATNPDAWSAFVGSGQWLKLELPVAIRLASYTLHPGVLAPFRGPKDFVVEGSNDDATWTPVDVRVGVTGWTVATDGFTFRCNRRVWNAFRYYRITVTAIQAGGFASIGEWKLYGDAGTSRLPWIAADGAGGAYVGGNYKADRPANLYHASGSLHTTMRLHSSGNSAAYIARYDPSGTVAWYAGWDSLTDTLDFPDTVTKIAADASNVYVAGSGGGNVYHANGDVAIQSFGLPSGNAAASVLIKYTDTGNVEWATYCDGMGAGGDVSTVPGNVYWATGSRTSTVWHATAAGPGTLARTIDVANSAAVLCKYASDGNCAWATRIDGAGDDRAWTVSGDALGVTVGGFVSNAANVYHANGSVAGALSEAYSYLARYNGSGLAAWWAPIRGNGVPSLADISGNVSTGSLYAGVSGTQQLTTYNANGAASGYDTSYPVQTGTAIVKYAGEPVVLVTDASGKLASSGVSAKSLWFLAGVQGNVQATIDSLRVTGGVSEALTANLQASRLLISNASGKLESSNIASSVLWYLDGLSSNVQARIDQMSDTFVGGAAVEPLLTQNATPDRVLVSNALGNIAESNISTATLWYTAGATSNVQIQLDAKQPSTTLVVGNATVTTGFTGYTGSDLLALFGDGGDGELYPGFGTVAMARDMYYGNVSFGPSDVIGTNGYRLFVKGTLDLTNGSATCIRRTAAAGGAGGGVGGAAQTVGGSSAGSTGGAIGASASNAAAQALGNGGVGGKGGNSATNLYAGGNGGTFTATFPISRVSTDLMRRDIAGIAFAGGGTGGGGGGGGDAVAGRGGGAGGAVMFVSARTIRVGSSNTRYIAITGGNGGNPAGTVSSGTIGHGGGGGGGGGWAYIVYGSCSGTGTDSVTAAGGPGGSGSSTTSLSIAPGYGGDGGAGGLIQLFNLSRGMSTTILGSPGLPGSAGSGTTGGAGGAGGECVATLV